VLSKILKVDRLCPVIDFISIVVLRIWFFGFSLRLIRTLGLWTVASYGNRCKVLCMGRCKFLSYLPQMVSAVLDAYILPCVASDCMKLMSSSTDWAQLLRIFTFGRRQNPFFGTSFLNKLRTRIMLKKISSIYKFCI
jgi:hypothetical protein